MTGQSLRSFGMHAGGGEIADKRVSKRVKISHAIRVVAIYQEVRGLPLLPRLGVLRFADPRFAGLGKVRTEHIDQMTASGHRECLGRRQFTGEIIRHCCGGCRPERQIILPAVLRVCGGDGHTGFGTIQYKASASQAPEFTGSQASFSGQPIKRRPGFTGHTKTLRRMAGDFQQLPQFLKAQSPSIVSSIQPNIDTLKMFQRIFVGPPIPHHPFEKALRITEIVIEAGRADALVHLSIFFPPLLAQVSQKSLGLAG